MTAAPVLRMLTIAALLTIAVERVAAQVAGLASASVQPHGFVVERPGNNAVSPRNGLRVEVDSRWVNNYGYRPLRVRVTSPRPAARDHFVTVRFYIAPWDWRSASVVAVEQEIKLPMGGTSAEAVVSCPQFQTGQRYWWDVSVNGVRDATLSVDSGIGWQLTAAGANVTGETTLKFLLLAPESQSDPVVVPTADVFDAVAVPIEHLPTRWLDYASVDVMAFSPNQLQRLETARPEALAAICRWVRAGGQLWVSPLGSSWEELANVESLLALEPQDVREGRRETDAEIAARGWLPIPVATSTDPTSVATFLHLPTGRSRTIRDPAIIARLKRDADWIVTGEQSTLGAEDQAALQAPRDDEASDGSPDGADDDANVGPLDSADWFVQRQVGLGSVRVFRRPWDAVGFGLSWRMLLGFGPPDPETSRTPLAAAVQSIRGWESRHGMTPDTANADFANLLVPGVGLAPVTEFRILITLFVLTIGPLNYWLLLRSGRLYLLVLTVPLVALLLTGALFGYALISDGFGTTVRVRSFTALDQRTGEAACWARLSYYAGLAPSQGFTMPDDVALYPIRPGWVEAGGGAWDRVGRKLEWIDHTQHFREGWLRSRTPTQYLAVRARRSPHRVTLQADGGTMTAINQLGTGIRYLAVMDDDGTCFAGESIDAGATVKLRPVAAADIRRQLRQRAAANEPEPPAALGESDVRFSSTGRRAYRRRYELEYGLERLDTNLMDQAIDAIINTGEEPLTNPQRSYVAITETGPEVVTGLPRVREEASFHVLVGRW